MSSKAADGFRRLTRSAGFRLTLWYASFFTAGCLLIFGLAYFLLSTSLAKRDHEAVLSKFWDLAGEYQDWGVKGLDKALASQERQRKTRPFFIQFSKKGREPVRLLRGEWKEYDLSGLEAPDVGAGERWDTFPSAQGSAELEVMSLRLSDGLLLQVGQTSDERLELLGRFRTIVLWSVLIVALVSVPGGYLLARRTLRPVRDLIATIKRIEEGAVGARVPTRGAGDEFDELGLLFNGMLARVETLIAGMKNALDNVAHDLRTPLTRLRAGAEDALTSETEPERLKDALADCVEESDRVVGMIETLMDISEAETGILKLRLETVDLSELLGETVDLYRYSAEEKGIALELSGAGPVCVEADRNRLRQVVANLIDNAVKYTPAGGVVRVEAVRRGSEAVVTVADTGAGIPEAEQAKVWDRLYRGDASRSQRGLGLGLSLVKAVVLAHRGRVGVRPASGGGAVFELGLPA